MAYLESRNYVHRALSAASVFMDNRNVCKIADCGLYEILIENEGNLLVQGGRAWFNHPLQLCYYIKKKIFPRWCLYYMQDWTLNAGIHIFAENWNRPGWSGCIHASMLLSWYATLSVKIEVAQTPRVPPSRPQWKWGILEQCSFSFGLVIE